MGPELDDNTLDRVYAFHRDTFLLTGTTVFDRNVFQRSVRTMAIALMVKLAVRNGTRSCGHFFLVAGRLVRPLLGSSSDYNSLQLEACYHPGIEFCIENRVARLSLGTQGDTKSAGDSSRRSPGLPTTLSIDAFVMHRKTILRARGRLSMLTPKGQAHVPYKHPPARRDTREIHHVGSRSLRARFVFLR